MSNPYNQESNPAMIQFLPREVMDMILDGITHVKDMNHVTQTCKLLHQEMMPRMYRRVEVFDQGDCQILLTIQKTKPHLTIKQKKQLKQQCMFNCQQESYPAGQDENVVPPCAAFVRELEIYFVSIKPEHENTPHYLEELLKNLSNLEVFETVFYNKSISESLVEKKYLKSLSLSATLNPNDYDLDPLGTLQGLENLRLVGDCWSPQNQGDIARLLLKNSMATLRSVEIQTIASMFDDELLALIERDSNNSVFKTLELLDIECSYLPENGIQVFHKIIDFTTLRNLSISGFRPQHKVPFINSCTNMFTSAKSVSLTHLYINMENPRDRYGTPEQEKAFADAIIKLLLSFSNLRSLELKGFGTYREIKYIELIPALLSAIFTHSNLITLKLSLSYFKAKRIPQFPFLSADMIGQIIHHLPLLKEFTFAPKDEELKEIADALSLAANLQHITCLNYNDKSAHFLRIGIGPDKGLVTTILEAFAARVPEELCDGVYSLAKKNKKKENSSSSTLWWNQHYKLKEIGTHNSTWEISPEQFQWKPKWKANLNVAECDKNSMCLWYRQYDYEYQPPWIDRLKKRGSNCFFP